MLSIIMLATEHFPTIETVRILKNYLRLNKLTKTKNMYLLLLVHSFHHNLPLVQSDL